MKKADIELSKELNVLCTMRFITYAILMRCWAFDVFPLILDFDRHALGIYHRHPLLSQWKCVILIPVMVGVDVMSKEYPCSYGKLRFKEKTRARLCHENGKLYAFA